MYIRKMMKLLYLLFVWAFILVFAYPSPIYAASNQSLCPGDFNSLCNLNVNKAGGIVGSIIQLLLIIAILAALFFLIYGGVRWITSGGDKGKIDQARGTLTAAVIGLIIALVAFFIVNIVLVFLTGQGISGMSIPKLI
ncbi:MAG TPA: hypothetical protein VNW29_02180 [Candidatus Sulfotelmatobacter sp.]|jgi:hypothetical protein|nr:hypothetical protein [Candidatus Sulfotelmatobacter sp.]